ncbi:histidinol-phosphatase HisJ family protein [Mycoplasma sp. NEAQ87857]|uniref:histidinol-phosphatase n=1 Tax=Mycoplasma sp. NEAQ87857 TaxID=2683967 RepID=UPI001316F683|nr:histidinol-phosphatase [Mycoplasma sp. NEAQ87857]QGZ97485.1 histidinol-phosphatase HisJ family protein [Mycoplasma sp. NEAQ87857]
MKYDYHMHTTYCKHADVSVEQLVAQHIKNQFLEIGISDHIPYPGKLDSKDNARMYLNEMQSYLNEIKQQKELHKDKIKILSGFESEYFPSMHQWYLELLKKDDVDYLILGIHAVENLDPENNFNKNCTNHLQLERYFKALDQGMRTNMFLYAVHPDFYMKSFEVWDDKCIELANKICDLALELDFPLGFNINGLWKGKRVIGNVYRNKYPIYEFWQIVKAKGVKIVLESDIHHQKQLYDNDIVNKTYQVLNDWGLIDLVIPRPNIERYHSKLKELNIK